jgi:cystathionine gamma-synthase
VNTGVELSATFEAGGELVYGRDGNATWAALEDAIGTLEGGTALAFASGMGAISAVFETLPMGATVVVAGDAYNGTRRFLFDVGSRGRLGVRPVLVSDTEATLAECEGAQLLWLESPTNPMMDIADLVALVRGAHERGVAVAVDNTFATPLLQRPLDHGADVVVHSVTKLLSGHSDIVLGAAVSRSPAWVEALRQRRSVHGAIPGPFEAFLALRGIRTLAVRLQRSQVTAAVLAERLQSHPAVSMVRYPGLASHPGRALAARQMNGFGTMLSFELAGGAGAADAVCAAVRLAVHGTSLGGVETLIERRGKYAGEEAVPPALLRLSVGLEHVDDLWADLEQALALAAAAHPAPKPEPLEGTVVGEGGGQTSQGEPSQVGPWSGEPSLVEVDPDHPEHPQL